MTWCDSCEPMHPVSARTERLPLVDPVGSSGEVREAFGKLPVINLFRAAANAEDLYPTFVELLLKLFKHLELDLLSARLVVLLVARLSDCHYVWRQNIVTARSVGATEEQINALSASVMELNVFTPEQRSILLFTRECVLDIEVSDATYQSVSSTHTPRQITELVFLAGVYMTICRLARTGAVPLDVVTGPSVY